MNSLNNKGMSLVETLIAAAILAIVMSGMITMQTSLQKETRALSEKLGALELEKYLISVLADGKLCTAELTPSDLNDNSSFNINVGNPSETILSLSKGIHASVSTPNKFIVAPGDQPSPLSKNLRVKNGGITVSDFVKEDDNQYSANIKVEFDSENLVRSIRPVSVKIPVFTDSSGTILGCGIGGGAFGGVFDDCSCKGWGRCKGNQLNGGKFSCGSGFTPYLFSAFDDRGKCGHALYACLK